MSSPPPASPPMVWPPSNPSGTVIPFPLPWGQTGCCPPGGMDALMKCYCDIQQASAFIGQVMLDQINNNPAIIQAIIAGIEASGSNLPLVGVTNGSDAQPGQVGEFMQFNTPVAYAAYPAVTTLNATVGVIPPGDWDFWVGLWFPTAFGLADFVVNPLPTGMSNSMAGTSGVADSTPGVSDITTIIGMGARGSFSVPTLINFQVTVNQGTTAGLPAGSANLEFDARRRR